MAAPMKLSFIVYFLFSLVLFNYLVEINGNVSKEYATKQSDYVSIRRSNNRDMTFSHKTVNGSRLTKFPKLESNTGKDFVIDKNHGLFKRYTSRSSIMSYRNKIAKSNLAKRQIKTVSDSIISKYVPGTIAPNFTVPTLRGALTFPGRVINHTTPIIVHSFNPESGFLRCLWNCSGTLDEFIRDSPNDTHYIFISNSPSAYENAIWMRSRFLSVINERNSLFPRLHFVTLSLSQLGNFIPELLWQWSCPDHNCGLAQVRISAPSLGDRPLVLARLDARYDWLPSPAGLTDKSLPLVIIRDPAEACHRTSRVTKGSVVLVPEGGCSYVDKIARLQSVGAAAVLLSQPSSSVLPDMTCDGPRCGTVSVPAAAVEYSPLLDTIQNATVRYQTTPSENFFFAIDQEGRLSEVGWLLYPTFRFLAWQAQWFTYKRGLSRRLATESDVLQVAVYNHTVMGGSRGAVSTVILPPLEALRRYQTVELDTSLSCGGKFDQSCPHWDHTVQLYVCCDHTSPLCGQELGRWISPFRRGIGRWLTPIHSLLPLLTSQTCMFTMKSVPWAMPWTVTMSLRFSDKAAGPHPAPFETQSLYHPQFTFDKHYNSHFNKTTFTLPPGTTKVELVSVITGHGSDNNGCGEFCVTSHHFVVNGNTYNRTFSIAGSPFGCADRVLEGVEPNEHGTWLYGRDGWCDGQQVTPWVVDITPTLRPTRDNVLTYHGLFDGRDPDPKENAGIMIFYSYLTFYREA